MRMAVLSVIASGTEATFLRLSLTYIHTYIQCVCVVPIYTKPHLGAPCRGHSVISGGLEGTVRFLSPTDFEPSTATDVLIVEGRSVRGDLAAEAICVCM